VGDFLSTQAQGKGHGVLTFEEYKAMFEAAPDGFVVVEGNGTIRAVNPKVEQMFGWKSGELEGRPIEVLVPEALRGSHQAHRDDFAKNPHVRPMGAGLDLRGQRRDGTLFPIAVSLSPWMRENGELRVICSVRDISAVRLLQNFSEGALRATEDERRRIARELHDDTAQRLATLILRVGTLARQRDHDERMSLFEQVRGEIVDAAEGVKRMARGLRPPELEELGLELALQAHARTMRETDVFEVEIEPGGVDPCLDETGKLVLYRIIQEAVSNARRHSGARKVHVRLARERDSVVAEVVDHGSGFALAGAVHAERGLGLLGMQERATMVGGRVIVESAPGKGTRVRTTIPVQPSSEDG
jgi:PAS domain S-box-containing protein